MLGLYGKASPLAACKSFGGVLSCSEGAFAGFSVVFATLLLFCKFGFSDHF